MAGNARGLVIELVRRNALGDPRRLRTIVLFDRILAEREVSPAVKRAHWRIVRYADPAEGSLDVMDSSSWLGRWIQDHARRDFELYGTPYLMEANSAELAELADHRMPRAMVLRLAKCRTERGLKSLWGE